MELALYDKKRVRLLPYDTYEERLSFVNLNILENNVYGLYYNISSRTLDEQQCTGMENRWIGIKNEKAQYNEHVKTVLNIIATYLLNAVNYSVKSQIARYCELYKKNDITGAECCELEELKANVLYHETFRKRDNKKDLVFYVNHKMENLLKNNIDKYLGIKNRSYTEQFMLADSIARLNTCGKNKENCMAYSKKIKENEGLRENILMQMRLLYKNKKKAGIKPMLELVEQIKQIDDENAYLKKQIEMLYDEYVFATEMT